MITLRKYFWSFIWVAGVSSALVVSEAFSQSAQPSDTAENTGSAERTFQEAVPLYDYNYRYFNHRDADGKVQIPAGTRNAASPRARSTTSPASSWFGDGRRSSVPNMIGEGPSAPVHILTYSYWGTEVFYLPNPNYDPRQESGVGGAPITPPLTSGSAPSTPKKEFLILNTGYYINSNNTIYRENPDGDQRVGFVNEDGIPMTFEEYGKTSTPLNLNVREKPADATGGQSKEQQQQEYSQTVPKFLENTRAVRYTEAVPIAVTPTMYVTQLNISENFNAEVQDRFYMDLRFMGDGQRYGHADGTNQVINFKSDVSRMTLGFEKVLWDGHTSIEMRLPLVLSGLKSSQHIVGTTEPEYGVEFGNMSFIIKNVLRHTQDFTVSWGAGFNLPTAKDIRLEYTSGTGMSPLEGKIQNRKFSFVPFLGAQWHPNDEVFGHILGQVDIAVGKNRMIFTDDEYKLTYFRTNLKDASLFRFNIGGGRWFYQHPSKANAFKLGGMVEFHYTGSIDNLDTKNVSSSDGYFTARRIKKNWQTVTCVLGIPIQTRSASILAFLGAPLTKSRNYNVEGGISVDFRF